MYSVMHVITSKTVDDKSSGVSKKKKKPNKKQKQALAAAAAAAVAAIVDVQVGKSTKKKGQQLAQANTRSSSCTTAAAVAAIVDVQVGKSSKNKGQQLAQANTRSSTCTGSSITNAGTHKVAVSCSKNVGNCKIEAITIIANKCNDCMSPNSNCPCDVKDSGYGSEANSLSSPNVSCSSSSERSEVLCSDGFCNHAHGSGSEELEEEHSQHHNCEQDSCDLHYCPGSCLSSLQQMLVSSLLIRSLLNRNMSKLYL